MITVKCVWEHNGDDTLLYATDFIGAFARGACLEEAKAKMPYEIISYLKWKDSNLSENLEIVVSEEKKSDLNIKDADSDVIFESEKEPFTVEEYEELKALALKSATDFLTLYNSIPDKSAKSAAKRTTFYGEVPRSAHEMYEHTKNVNSYYFAEIGISTDNDGDIFECRKRGFEILEAKGDFLNNSVFNGSYGETWSCRKVMRRFIWHDRIHAKAMYKMANKLFGCEKIEDPYFFSDMFSKK